MEGDESVWAQTASGGMLQDLFGHQPTFENARLKLLTREADRLEMTLDCEDRIASVQHAPLKIRVRLCWSEVKVCKLACYSNDILGIRFSEHGGQIRTDFLECAGTWGHVVSGGLDLVLEQVDPPEEDEFEENTFHLRLA